jgi:hypothetical protein
MDIRYKTLSNDNEFWLSDNYEVYLDIDISSGCELLLPKKFILDKLYETGFYNIHVIIEDDELFLKPLEFVYEHNGEYLIPNIYPSIRKIPAIIIIHDIFKNVGKKLLTFFAAMTSE